MLQKFTCDISYYIQIPICTYGDLAISFKSIWSSCFLAILMEHYDDDNHALYNFPLCWVRFAVHTQDARNEVGEQVSSRADLNPVLARGKK